MWVSARGRLRAVEPGALMRESEGRSYTMQPRAGSGMARNLERHLFSVSYVFMLKTFL